MITLQTFCDHIIDFTTLIYLFLSAVRVEDVVEGKCLAVVAITHLDFMMIGHADVVVGIAVLNF